MRSKLPLLLLAVSAVVFVASVFSLAPSLPERVATHFNGAGEPNGWMTRRAHLICISLLGFGLPALVMGICSILSFLPPSLLSVPNADYWRSPEHYPEACRMGFNWSLWFGAMSLLWTAGLHYELVQANRLTPPHLDSARFLILTGAFILGMAVLAIGLLRSFRRAAQPA